jgi:hypothetical protein
MAWIISMRSDPSALSTQCPVCGYPDLAEPPRDETGLSTFTICPSCGTEFGYDDATLSHQALRDAWKNSGMKWWSAGCKPPPGWDPVVQVARVERDTP